MTTNAVFETDQEFDGQNALVSVIATPNDPSLLIGAYSGDGSFASTDSVRFRWRPFLGVEGGYRLVDGEATEQEDGIARVVGRVRGELSLESVKRLTSLNTVSVFADHTVRALILEDDVFRHFFEAGLVLGISDNVVFQVIYKNGETAPLFAEIETLEVSFGVKF